MGGNSLRYDVIIEFCFNWKLQPSTQEKAEGALGTLIFGLFDPTIYTPIDSHPLVGYKHVSTDNELGY